VRRCLALLFAAALALADDDAELVRVVDGLVHELGAPTADARTLARFRLAAYGEKIRPLLERVESDDPEVRRAIRRLTRSPGDVQLELLPVKDGALAIGAELVLEVRILNNSEQTLWLLPASGRQGEQGPFRIRVGKQLVSLRFDQVNWGDGNAVILPGASRRFRLSLAGNDSPLRRPALYDVSVVFDGQVGRTYGGAAEFDGETGPLVRESAPIQTHVLGRKADDLEQALAAEGVAEREAAAKELSLRDDDAVVPILRRHARERPLRLAAIRRLGALGAEEDFDLILEATRDENADVRRAAVLGLAKYGSAKARRRLLDLASDHELQADAIRALKGQKHPATVDCFVRLLRSGHCTPASVKDIRRTILQWTGIAVDERPSEIRAFQTWWEANRARWAEENASGK
jgi:HEAT repeat protein